ncbi:MAG: DUF5119 domain-containing protein [Bacteroidales bacterium]|nr:DUF5119 domain-containing protein [Bacteroidales bacterium]
MNRNTLLQIPLMLLLLLLLLLYSSCDHKELCYDHVHGTKIQLEYDWSAAPEAQPRGMCAFFYPDEPEGEVLRYDFTGRDGGEITVPVGSYQVIAYNNDTEATQFQGWGSLSTHEAFTREGNVLEPVLGSGVYQAPRATGSENEPVVIQPDMVWSATRCHVTVTADTRVIVLRPEVRVCTYSYEIRHVSNLAYISQCCASLSGLSPTLWMADDIPGDGQATIPFEAISDGESTITGEFLTFGYDTHYRRENRFLLYVWLSDGQKLCYGTESARFEVSEQIRQAPDPRHVHIIIDGLELPTPSGNANGYAPSVDDWSVENQDVVM